MVPGTRCSGDSIVPMTFLCVLDGRNAGEEKVILWAHLFSIELNNPVETSEDSVGECKNEYFVKRG